MLLRKEMFGLAQTKKKKSTSRFGARDIKLGELTLKMTEDETVTLTVNIIKVTYTTFKYIDDEEAIKEGYSCSNQLKNILRKLYPEIENDSVVTLIEWE